jgi:hypothetical protein
MDHEGCLHFQLWIEHQENKIRTIVTERIEAAKMAKQADWGVMTSPTGQLIRLMCSLQV